MARQIGESLLIMGEVPSLLMNSKSEFGSNNTIPRITITTEMPDVVEPPLGFTLNPTDHLTQSRPPKRSRLGASQPLSIDEHVSQPLSLLTVLPVRYIRTALTAAGSRRANLGQGLDAWTSNDRKRICI